MTPADSPRQPMRTASLPDVELNDLEEILIMKRIGTSKIRDGQLRVAALVEAMPPILCPEPGWWISSGIAEGEVHVWDDLSVPERPGSQPESLLAISNAAAPVAVDEWQSTNDHCPAWGQGIWPDCLE